jgi:ribulose 1,5-bisphosphate synthetase/thiazole synthase
VQMSSDSICVLFENFQGSANLTVGAGAAGLECAFTRAPSMMRVRIGENSDPDSGSL